MTVDSDAQSNDYNGKKGEIRGRGGGRGKKILQHTATHSNSLQLAATANGVTPREVAGCATSRSTCLLASRRMWKDMPNCIPICFPGRLGGLFADVWNKKKAK